MGTEKSEQNVAQPSDVLPQRYGWQDRQEALSKAQFVTLLSELGWNKGELSKDLGEDFLVQVYDDGESSGLSFFVQLKSTTDIEELKLKSDPTVLRYSLEVKDLKHWEGYTTPVVLIVWDVKTRVGCWETIPRIIDELEKENKGWRGQKSVTISVPVENGTDEEGMRRLRRLLADELLEWRFGREDMTFTMQFPATADGLRTLTAFNNALDWGEEVTLEGPGVPEIEEPSLYRRLYGKQIRSQSVRITITPTADGFTIPVRVEVRSHESCASMPNVELRAIKQGRKHQVFTNEHQDPPIVFILSGDDESGGTFKIRHVRHGRTIQEARETLDFLRAMQQSRSHLRLYDARNGKMLLELPVSWHQSEALDVMHDALKKLTILEPYISKFGTVQLDEGIGRDDHLAIEILYQAFKHGKVRLQKRLNLKVAPDADDYPSIGSHKVEIESSNKNMSLLGLEIPLGRVRETIDDPSAYAAAMRTAITQARATGRPVPVEVANVQVTTEFLDWPPPRDRLQDLAATQSGYFTLAQALKAGFSSAEQLQIHERVERCADRVYRFVLDPASDREDLVVTWLQTEKQGVFSHDTALALHQLSDILPDRQHITVPPGWKPIEGMALAANTVVHEGTVESNEMSWMGPVPFTKPLRTLVDCIDDVLPPDILEQALSDAYGRGMLSPAELQSLQARKAKSA